MTAWAIISAINYLVEIASRLKSSVRQRDIVARLGGDEFIMLLENLGEDEKSGDHKSAGNRSKNAQRHQSAYIVRTERNIKTSISIGISLFDENHKSFDETLKCADAALYQAKDAGRNTLRFFDPKMQALVESRLLLEFDLRHALDQNQLSLHYQAQVDKNGHIIRCGSLAPLDASTKRYYFTGRVYPDRGGIRLILPIGNWVLQSRMRAT